MKCNISVCSIVAFLIVSNSDCAEVLSWGSAFSIAITQGDSAS
jgi:hypothetical protein